MKTRTKALSIAGGAILASSILAFQTFNRDTPRMTFETIPLDTAVFSEEDPLGAKALSDVVDITNAVKTTVDATTGERTTSLNGNVTIDGNPVASMVDVEGKQDKLPYQTNAIPYSVISGIPETEGGITTNDVRNIVTNETVAGFSAWNVTPDPMQQPDVLSWNIDWNGADGDDSEWSLAILGTDNQLLGIYSTNAPGRATSLTFGPYTATRSPIIRNSLGFARLVDLPPPSNNLKTNDVCAIVTNVTSRFSTWTIMRENVDVTAQMEQPFYGPTDDGDGWTVSAIPSDESEPPYMILTGIPENVLTLEWLVFAGSGDTVNYTATRTPITRNSLGLARLVDIPPTISSLSSIPGAEAAATNAIRKIQASDNISEIKVALVEFLESFKSSSPSN